jgi:hypothetical protein
MLQLAPSKLAQADTVEAPTMASSRGSVQLLLALVEERLRHGQLAVAVVVRPLLLVDLLHGVATIVVMTVVTAATASSKAATTTSPLLLVVALLGARSQLVVKVLMVMVAMAATASSSRAALRHGCSLKVATMRLHLLLVSIPPHYSARNCGSKLTQAQRTISHLHPLHQAVKRPHHLPHPCDHRDLLLPAPSLFLQRHWSGFDLLTVPYLILLLLM